MREIGRSIPLARIAWCSALLVSLAGFLLSGGTASGVCPAGEDLSPLSRIAGKQDQPPPRTPVVTEGTVTGVFPGRDGLNGFFVQDRVDGHVTGLFVYAPAFTGADWERVFPGARVRIEALSGEFRGRRQLHRVQSVRLCGEPGLPAAEALRLPLEPSALEDLHAVLVRFPQTLTVTGNHTLGRYGSLRVSAGSRLYRHQVPEDGLHAIILDDGSYRSDPDTVPYLDAHGTRRTGDTVAVPAGVLAHAFGEWRVHPVEAPVFASGNPRTPLPEPVHGLRVATFNLENYFIVPGERGAVDRAALARQRSKLLTALEGLDADLLALVEVQNSREALADLVRRLNARFPDEREYRMLPGAGRTGDDAIMTALVYRPASLEPLAPPRRDHRPVHDRPPVLAAFRNRQSDEVFLAAAVHFKSKAACPDAGDVDRGEGCWNRRRTAQAGALMESVRTFAGELGVSRVLLAGDFNSYAGEKPVRLLANAGYRNLPAVHVPAEHRYTYVFRGEAGMLDYVFANPDLAVDVAGATIWHINADEPPFLSYDGRAGRGGVGFGQPWRSSDHDPVLIGLDR